MKVRTATQPTSYTCIPTRPTAPGVCIVRAKGRSFPIANSGCSRVSLTPSAIAEDGSLRFPSPDPLSWHSELPRRSRCLSST